jgi:hypothetical protein
MDPAVISIALAQAKARALALSAARCQRKATHEGTRRSSSLSFFSVVFTEHYRKLAADYFGLRELLATASAVMTRSWGPSWEKQLPGERPRETAEKRHTSPQPSRYVRRKGAASLSGSESRPHAPLAPMRSAPAYKNLTRLGYYCRYTKPHARENKSKRGACLGGYREMKKTRRARSAPLEFYRFSRKMKWYYRNKITLKALWNIV